MLKTSTLYIAYIPINAMLIKFFISDVSSIFPFVFLYPIIEKVTFLFKDEPKRG